MCNNDNCWKCCYGQLIDLQATEIRLIEYLAYHAGQVVNKPGLKVLVSLPNGK